MQEAIVVKGARLHNLKNVTLSIPKNKLVVFTGLSGSGKSTLAFDTLHKEGQRQYMESLGLVTDYLSKPPVEAIPDVLVRCAACGGQRFNERVLAVRYRGQTIGEVLEMTIERARDLFADVPAAADRLNLLSEVGLGYLKLGQPATTLSGGEAQRVKLSKELARRATGRTLYLLDEPTTGLHPADVAHLLKLLHGLVDGGNTVVVIEHNLDVIRSADWVIDLGPEGGADGGCVVAEGPPEAICEVAESRTGACLR